MLRFAQLFVFNWTSTVTIRERKKKRALGSLIVAILTLELTSKGVKVLFTVALGIEGWLQEGPGVSNIVRDRVLDSKSRNLKGCLPWQSLGRYGRGHNKTDEGIMDRRDQGARETGKQKSVIFIVKWWRCSFKFYSLVRCLGQLSTAHVVCFWLRGDPESEVISGFVGLVWSCDSFQQGRMKPRLNEARVGHLQVQLCRNWRAVPGKVLSSKGRGSPVVHVFSSIRILSRKQVMRGVRRQLIFLFSLYSSLTCERCFWKQRRGD